MNSLKKTNGNCTIWYIETTYYYSDGSTSTTTEYLFTSCDEDSDLSGGGGNGSGQPNPEEPNDTEITVTYNFAKPELYFGYEDQVQPIPLEQDDVDADGNVQPPGIRYEPVKYEFRVTIALTEQTHVVTAAVQSPVIANPRSGTYIHPSGLTVTREVTPITLGSLYPPFIGNSVNCYWSYDVNFRWTYSNGYSPPTRQYHYNYAQVVTVP